MAKKKKKIEPKPIFISKTIIISPIL